MSNTSVKRVVGVAVAAVVCGVAAVSFSSADSTTPKAPKRPPVKAPAASQAGEPSTRIGALEGKGRPIEGADMATFDGRAADWIRRGSSSSEPRGIESRPWFS